MSLTRRIIAIVLLLTGVSIFIYGTWLLSPGLTFIVLGFIIMATVGVLIE